MPESIAILAPSPVPFQIGGAENLLWALRASLGAISGNLVELIKMPFCEDSFRTIVDGYEAFSRLNLNHFDMLITCKYPAWIAPHPNHAVYMMHHLRGLFDTYHFTGLPETLAIVPEQIRELVALIRKQNPDRCDLDTAFELCRRALAIKSIPSSFFSFPGPLIRELVHFFDRVALAPGQIRKYMAISATVAARRNYFPKNVPLMVMWPPSGLAAFRCGEGKYFFTASRLNSCKRVRLLIRAMAHMPLDVPLLIAGTGPEEKHLKSLAAGDSRIQFTGHVTDNEMMDLYAGALAVLFAPYDEDYGLITIEAMKSGKPVITTADSGGVCEIVRDGETGFVVEPTAPALAGAMEKLARDRALAARMGEQARKSVADINWTDFGSRFMACIRSADKPAVLVAAPFQADAHGAGGPRRLYHFCAELGTEYSVILICYGSKTLAALRERTVPPGIRELALPWPENMLADAESLAGETCQSADDIAIMRHAANDCALLTALRREGDGAACVVLSHPWLFPAVEKALPELALVYDAHNVESDLKQMLFTDPAFASETWRLENAVCRRATIVFTCSQADLERLAALYDIPAGKLQLLPHGSDYAVPGKSRSELRKRLPYQDARLALFLASGHKPNVDAVQALARIAARLPDVQFLIAGSVSTQPETRNAALPENMHLLGMVSETVKNLLLCCADLGLNPVMAGSGVNLKTIEYICAGLPCLTTPTGARGLENDMPQTSTVCELEQFPEKIRTFFDSPSDDAYAAEAGRVFRDAHSWKHVLAPLLPTLAALRISNAPSD